MNAKYSGVTDVIPWFSSLREENGNFTVMESSLPINIKDEICEIFRCVFVNGFYRSDLSRLPGGIEVLSLKQARYSYNNLFMTDASTFPKTPFSELHFDTYEGGAFIYVYKSDFIFDIEIVNYVTDKSLVVLPRLYMVVGSHCKINLKLRTEDICRDGHVNGKLEFFIEDDGTCCMELIPGRQTAEEVWTVFSLLKLRASQDFRVIHDRETLGVKFYDSQTFLREQDSRGSFSLKGDLKGKSRLFANIRMEHEAHDTVSNQNIRTIIDEESSVIFQGEIYIHPQAENTVAGQRHDSLVLSDEATIETNPSLDIFADKVKASHGATLGRLNETAAFYLRSRGVGEARVIDLLKQAFLNCGNEGLWS